MTLAYAAQRKQRRAAKIFLCHVQCLSGYWTTRGYANSRIANSRTGHLADWSTRGLDNSRTGQVADWTTRGCHRRLWVLSFPFWRYLRDRELSSPRVDQSASWQSASWRIRELSSYRLSRVTIWVGRLRSFLYLFAVVCGLQADP